MRQHLIKFIEDEYFPDYSKYLEEKMKEQVPDLDEVTSWLFSDGYYGPSYYNFDEEEITGTEADKLREECLSKLSDAIDVIDDFIVEAEEWFDEEGNELDEPIRYEEDRINSRDIAKEVFWYVVEIYGGLP